MRTQSFEIKKTFSTVNRNCNIVLSQYGRSCWLELQNTFVKIYKINLS